MVHDSICEKENIDSQRCHDDPDWDYFAYSGVFSCALQCTNNSCRDYVSVSGISHCGEDDHGCFVTCFEPQMFTPALYLLQVPDECPENVSRELKEAFKLYWCDLASGINHIRKAVELIMDHLKIPKTCVDKKKKRRPLPLHDRIAIFRSQNPANSELADRLEAVKWLGNAGSHSSEVSHDMLFDAVDLLEDFIHTRFEKRHNKIVALTKKVIKRKGNE
jgi:hypothetical protein